MREVRKLPARFRAAPEVCYRKRFLFKKDMEPLVMFEGLDDRVASWSTDRAFAMDFKGLVKLEAVTAAYFEHKPLPDEVIVNFPALWADPGFQEATDHYRKRGRLSHPSAAQANFDGGEQNKHPLASPEERLGRSAVVIAISSYAGKPAIGRLKRTQSIKHLKIQFDHAGEIAMAAAALRMRTCIIALVLLLTTISVACAADQTIILRLGAPMALELERTFKTVLIGDPNIVDVHTLNDRRITLEPLNLGATNLIFVDDRSIAITNLRIVVRDDAEGGAFDPYRKSSM
ncbi:MAG TPA: pilus assembly protein N-terminal domain-containing protein [Bradyrhizobium sp.]|nr:pilus assembly protein N-terminal domain-containing protein [Bradyrhizobium sp.]